MKSSREIIIAIIPGRLDDLKQFAKNTHFQTNYLIAYTDSRLRDNCILNMGQSARQIYSNTEDVFGAPGRKQTRHSPHPSTVVVPSGLCASISGSLVIYQIPIIIFRK